FTSTVEPLTTAFFAGVTMRREGLALSCSPRCFIISSIEDGRGTTFNSWAISGDAVEVAVVFVFSLAGSQAPVANAPSRKRANQSTVNFLGCINASSTNCFGFEASITLNAGQ